MSAAYYALFHLLTQDAAERFARWPELRPLLARKFNHGPMKQASKQVSAKRQVKNPPDPLPSSFSEVAGDAPADLKVVAEAFAELHESRQRADYDPRAEADFDRTTALVLVNKARFAFEAWALVRETLAAEAFLLATLLQDAGR